MSQVDGVIGTPEKAMGRRLSLLSDQNVMSGGGMSPMDDKERTRRRSSLPTKDMALILPGVQDVPEEDDVEEDMWEASVHVLKV